MRTVSGMMLAAAVGLAAGCGGGADPKPQPAVEVKAPAEGGDKAAPPAKDDPKPDVPTPPPQPPAPTAAWEMDPAKHLIPTAPPAGKVAGAAFAPEAEFQGDTLRFRVADKDGAERAVSLTFTADKAKAVAGGLKLTVRPDQLAGPDVPTVLIESPPPKAGAPAGVTQLANGYALTLDLGKRASGKLPGKVYLSLPGDEKDFLAGTFAADWVRPTTELPGPDDAPFVQGKVTLAGGDAAVKVGYVGLPTPADAASDFVQTGFVGKGWARSDSMKPRATLVVAAPSAGEPARYEHTQLPPARYLVYAAIADGGPVAWKWVAVGPGAAVTADFALDPKQVGKLDVKVPAGTAAKVQLVPADEPGQTIPPTLAVGIALSLGLEATPKDGAAAFDKLGPGRYEVRAGDLTETVEVKAGQTAKVDLAAKKK